MATERLGAGGIKHGAKTYTGRRQAKPKPASRPKPTRRK